MTNSKKNIILGNIFLALMIATDVFIIVEAATKGSASATQSTGLSTWIASIINTVFPFQHTDASDPTYLYIMRKMIGHFSLFGVSGLWTMLAAICLVSYAVKQKWWLFLAAETIGFVLAGCSEIIQLFVPGRSGAFTDVLIDFAGYLLFSMIVFLIYLAIYHHQKSAAQKAVQ